MSRILLKSGWLGRNSLAWYSAPDSLGEQIFALHDALRSEGHDVYFKGDVTGPFRPDIEIHLDRQIPDSFKSKKILVATEPYFVQPQNVVLPTSYYDLIYTLRSDVKHDDRVRPYSYPRTLTKIPTKPFVERDILISCIAGNKNAVINSEYNLYPVRQRYIAYLERRFGGQFQLYGGGWDKRDHPVGLAHKVAFRLRAFDGFYKRKAPLASYVGRCDSKGDVMQRSRFYLCIENTSEPGAMTEKIVDCFQYGTVPLYLGASDIAAMIDPELYIDLRNFPIMDDMAKFIERFSENDYLNWYKKLTQQFQTVSQNRSVDRFLREIMSGVRHLDSVIS